MLKLFAAAQSSISLEFKALVALRVLERNKTADDRNELSGRSIGESTVKTFIANFARHAITSALESLRDIFSYSHREYA